ncbi:hypothetical protein Tco_0407133 [Tanacetum coccineum]
MIWVNNKFVVRAGKQEARLSINNLHFQDSGVGSSSHKSKKKELDPGEDIAELTSMWYKKMIDKQERSSKALEDACWLLSQKLRKMEDGRREQNYQGENTYVPRTNEEECELFSFFELEKMVAGVAVNS